MYSAVQILLSSETVTWSLHYAFYDKIWSVRCTNQNHIVVALVLAVLSIITQQEELMKWHPIGVTRTRIRVIGVNVNEMLIKVKEI